MAWGQTPAPPRYGGPVWRQWLSLFFIYIYIFFLDGLNRLKCRARDKLQAQPKSEVNKNTVGLLSVGQRNGARESKSESEREREREVCAVPRRAVDRS